MSHTLEEYIVYKETASLPHVFDVSACVRTVYTIYANTFSIQRASESQHVRLATSSRYLYTGSDLDSGLVTLPWKSLLQCLSSTAPSTSCNACSARKSFGFNSKPTLSSHVHSRSICIVSGYVEIRLQQTEMVEAV